MLELTLRVAAADVEEVLDAVLPALPGGVHLRADGEAIEMRVPGAPGEEQLRALVGARLIELSREEVPDDWRERRLSHYEPLVVANRFLVRPDWAPSGDDEGLVEIVLEQSTAFGTGVHPTTQACLAALAEATPDGSFADYGCGSGVLSIAAARLGWSPVLAVDIDEPSVAAARRNADRNGVEVEARSVDLTSEPPPPADTIAANIPPAIHTALASRIEHSPRLVIASGFKGEDSERVATAWGAHGLRVSEELAAMEWLALVLR